MNKSEIFKSAWSYLKANIVTTFSEALKLAWKRFKLILSLKKGISYFSYRKANGTLREAIGTLREGNFEYVFKTEGGKERFDVIKYFDIESKGWRSCRIERLV